MSNQAELKLEYVDINDLKPYPNNPRRNDEAVKYVANSIQQFGFKIPMVIDKDNVIVCGHTRYKAAKELGLEKVPCVRADDLSEKQIKALRLVDNKTSEISSWDFDLLDSELLDLQDLDVDLSLFANDNTFDIFDDLQIERIGQEVVHDEFSITFVFPKEKEEAINKLIKDKTKQYIVDKIIALSDENNEGEVTND